MYTLIGSICKRTEAGESLKNILYNLEKGKYDKQLPSIRSLADTTLRNKVIIDKIISKTKLAEEVVFNEVWTARVLVAELIFGKKSYHVTDGISKKVYKYKKELKELAEDIDRKERAFIPRYCRLNTFKCTKAEFLSGMAVEYRLKEIGGKSELSYEEFLKDIKELKKNEYIQDYHLSDLYIFHPKANLTTTHLYQENKIILQDKASCLVAPLLAPTPDSLMIDMCAAPGFKTQHLSSISGGSGLILAIDISKDRSQTLAETRINYDMSNVMTFNADALHLPELATKCIEYVLLDAPCSGSGVVGNYDYGTDNRRDKNRLNSLHNLQAALLRTALTTYTSARRIVYSTCSINEEENESVVEEVLKIAEDNQFILVNLKNHLQDFTSGLEKYKCGKSCIRLMPEQSCTNGFFIALFERTNPMNPTPRVEFYKNLNNIIDEISFKRKRKADNDELNENLNDKDVNLKKIKEDDTKLNTNETKVEKNQSSSSDEDTSSSDDSSSDDDEEVKKTMSSPVKENQVKTNYIRVVRSPLLKNPVPSSNNNNNNTDSDEDSDESDDENDDAEGTFKPISNSPVTSNNSRLHTSRSISKERSVKDEKSDDENDIKKRDERINFENNYNEHDKNDNWNQRNSYSIDNRSNFQRNDRFNSRSFRRGGGGGGSGGGEGSSYRKFVESLAVNDNNSGRNKRGGNRGNFQGGRRGFRSGGGGRRFWD
ncbi:hypothetical protein O3M35_012268 [Rhynocoris fuscipes]|uniref:SAM-dependent MTase RsmB/NOP-type domain-containing protein n=1 Tax=Rhynocoris fuscipes TaxID=488301 RepID=A0AAW1CVQ7_9HEMI